MVGQTPVLRILENVSAHFQPGAPQVRSPPSTISFSGREYPVDSSRFQRGACSRWSRAASCGGVQNLPGDPAAAGSCLGLPMVALEHRRRATRAARIRNRVQDNNRWWSLESTGYPLSEYIHGTHPPTHGRPLELPGRVVHPRRPPSGAAESPAGHHTAECCTQHWDRDILPALMNYVRIPARSPSFDPDWQASGHIDRAVALVEAWCRARPVPGLSVEVVRLADKTPVLLMEVPARGMT